MPKCLSTFSIIHITIAFLLKNPALGSFLISFSNAPRALDCAERTSLIFSLLLMGVIGLLLSSFSNVDCVICSSSSYKVCIYTSYYGCFLLSFYGNSYSSLYTNILFHVLVVSLFHIQVSVSGSYILTGKVHEIAFLHVLVDSSLGTPIQVILFVEKSSTFKNRAITLFPIGNSISS